MTEDTTIKKSQEQFPNATPRPWRADRHDIIGGEGKNFVALVCAGGTRTGNANRNLILEAVNSYDALREAAEAALKWFAWFDDVYNTGAEVKVANKLSAALVDTNTTTQE